MSVSSQRISFLIFLVGKTLRFGIFVVFLVFLVNGVNDVAGYDTNQVVFFFLTFNLIDIFSQFLFREVYRFRPQVVSGSFDLILSKPQSALVRVLVGGADPIDLVTLPPLIIFTIVVGRTFDPTAFEVLVYIGLLANGLLIAAAFHIAVLAIGIRTLEIDHTIMIYRDLVNLGRFPIDIYKEPLRAILTYIIPVSIMISVPSEYLIGSLSGAYLIVAFLISAVFFGLSLKFWKSSLSFYTSASS